MKSRALLSFFLVIAACVSAPPSPTNTASSAERFNRPQEASEFEREQRLAWSSGIDPRQKYDEAVAWREARERTFSKSHGSAAWQELGPGNIGGRVRALVIDPINPQRMLLGGVSGGVWRSDDGGGNWRPTGDSLTNVAVNSMVLDAANPAVVYAGTGEGYFREEVRGTDLPLRGGGVFVSHDFGATWSFLASTASPDFYWVNDLEVSALDSQRVYAATRSGVFRSDDSGSTWKKVLTTEARGGCLDLALRTDARRDVLLASCGTLGPATIFYNDDAASDSSTWVAVLGEEGMGRTSLAISKSSPNFVYALAARNAPGDEERDQALFAVFRSDRGGETGSWTTVARGDGADLQSTILSDASLEPTCTSGAKPRYYVNMGWYTNVIAVDPVNPMRVWAGGVSLYRSDDGGATWGKANDAIHVDQHRIVFSPSYDGTSNRTMFVTNDGGIYETDDATASVSSLAQLCAHTGSQISWRSLNRSLGVTQLYHGVVSGATLFAGSQDNGFLRSGSEANDWTMVAGGDVGYSAIDATNPNVIYAMTAFGIVKKSTNGGSRFVGVSPPPEERFLFITPMVLDPRAGSTLWIAGKQVWRSTTGASSWVAATSLLPDGVASAIATSPHDPDQLFVGTNSGAIYRSSSARASVNATWEVTLPRRGFVSAIVVDPSSSNTVYATYSGFGGAHVWRSTDGGASWSEVDGIGDGRLPDIPIHSAAVDASSGTIYIASDIGVLMSPDHGTTWRRAGSGLPNVVTKWLQIATMADGQRVLVAFTHGRGAWELELRSSRRHLIRR